MEKKQSSIDWLKDKLNGVDTGVSYHYFNSIIQEAKAMHKEEIKDAWLNGMKGEMIAPFGMNRYKPEAEEYYNETFGGYTGVIGVDNISWTNTNKLNNGGNNE